MIPTKNIPDKASSSFTLLVKRVNKWMPPKAFFLLMVVIAVLSVLVTVNFSTRKTLLTEGEIAPQDVIADTSIRFRDRWATAARQENARKMQPLVVDFTMQPIETLRETVQNILLRLGEAQSPEQRAEIYQHIANELGESFTAQNVEELADPVVQNAILASLLPQAEQALRSGVLRDLSVISGSPGGVIVCREDTGEETFMQDTYGLPDLVTLELQLAQSVNKLNIPHTAKKAVTQLFNELLQPTLNDNIPETHSRAEEAARAVEPVMYRVHKGEVIIQKGDRVTRDQQLKMQVLTERKDVPFQIRKALGVFLCAMIISLGMLFSPSGKNGSAVTNKDFIFLSVLLVLFSLMAKGISLHGAQLAAASAYFMPESLAFAMPVAGAAALSSQILSTRRYLVTGLLLAYFCAIMAGGGLSLFLFYFLSAMLSTWLTGRSHSRQDVVWSLFPLALGMLAIWAGSTLVQDGAYNRFFSEIVAVLAGALLSMVITFALSPVLEMVFGYTTRFKLMELMNLEQPLLRDLMITAPGTYHHSLIVSNMCEAGAKRVGAHSLLCKVAALYHDIGKITKAGYFIENQPTDDNPHNRLTPSMSALILISHVKQGVDLARQHRLGEEVTDIIRQHHGTSIIQYFYRKALNQTDAAPPNIEDFRYPGPRPRSREAALVMLADIVEASSRTLSDPTPTRLRQHIDNIMKGTYSAGQLDESELTFKDLDLLADSFQQVLRGLYHHRIAYPGGPTGKAVPPLPAIKGSEAKAPEAKTEETKAEDDVTKPEGAANISDAAAAGSETPVATSATPATVSATPATQTVSATPATASATATETPSVRQ